MSNTSTTAAAKVSNSIVPINKLLKKEYGYDQKALDQLSQNSFCIEDTNQRQEMGEKLGLKIHGEIAGHPSIKSSIGAEHFGAISSVMTLQILPDIIANPKEALSSIRSFAHGEKEKKQPIQPTFFKHIPDTLTIKVAKKDENGNTVKNLDNTTVLEDREYKRAHIIDIFTKLIQNKDGKNDLNGNFISILEATDEGIREFYKELDTENEANRTPTRLADNFSPILSGDKSLAEVLPYKVKGLFKTKPEIALSIIKSRYTIGTGVAALALWGVNTAIQNYNPGNQVENSAPQTEVVETKGNTVKIPKPESGVLQEMYNNGDSVEKTSKATLQSSINFALNRTDIILSNFANDGAYKEIQTNDGARIGYVTTATLKGKQVGLIINENTSNKTTLVVVPSNNDPASIIRVDGGKLIGDIEEITDKSKLTPLLKGFKTPPSK